MIRVVAEGGETISPANEVRPDLVAHLERLLRLAKDGQIRALAFVAEGPHKMDSGFCNIDTFYESIYLLGYLERLKKQVMERADALADELSHEVSP